MLAFAADEEVLHSGRTLFRDHVDGAPKPERDEVKAQAKRMRPAEYVGVDVVTQVGDQFDVGTRNAVLGVELEGTTGDATVESSSGPFRNDRRELARAVAEHRAVQRQPRLPEGPHGGRARQAFKSTLDSDSHRLDAWITSLATEATRRDARAGAQGVHIGAFGVVEDPAAGLRAATRPGRRQLGYVHAPSLQQAADGGRFSGSGHLANKQATAAAFNIDPAVASGETREAAARGLASGQWMAALLGYRVRARAAATTSSAAHPRVAPGVPASARRRQGERRSEGGDRRA
jgi:hypothetical protein